MRDPLAALRVFLRLRDTITAGQMTTLAQLVPTRTISAGKERVGLALYIGGWPGGWRAWTFYRREHS